MRDDGLRDRVPRGISIANERRKKKKYFEIRVAIFVTIAIPRSPARSRDFSLGVSLGHGAKESERPRRQTGRHEAEKKPPRGGRRGERGEGGRKEVATRTGTGNCYRRIDLAARRSRFRSARLLCKQFIIESRRLVKATRDARARARARRYNKGGQVGTIAGGLARSRAIRRDPRRSAL